MGLIPPGRPKGPPKSRKIWLGQRPQWVLNAIIGYTDVNERFDAVWALVEERSGLTYDRRANSGDKGEA